MAGKSPPLTSETQPPMQGNSSGCGMDTCKKYMIIAAVFATLAILIVFITMFLDIFQSLGQQTVGYINIATVVLGFVGLIFAWWIVATCKDCKYCIPRYTSCGTPVEEDIL